VSENPQDEPRGRSKPTGARSRARRLLIGSAASHVWLRWPLISNPPVCRSSRTTEKQIGVSLHQPKSQRASENNHFTIQPSRRVCGCLRFRFSFARKKGRSKDLGVGRNARGAAGSGKPCAERRRTRHREFKWPNSSNEPLHHDAGNGMYVSVITSTTICLPKCSCSGGERTGDAREE